MFIDRIKYAITIKASFLIFFITLLATIIRPTLVDQDAVFTYIGIVNTAVLGFVFLFMRYTKPKAWYPFVFVLLGLAVLTPIALVSGGVNSQFSYLYPIIPVFIALVSNPKYTWATTLTIFLIVVFMYLSVEYIPNYTYENVPASKTASRALWLCFSVLLSAAFGIEFNRANNALGNKLSTQAEIDMLTGVANRRSALDYLSNTLEQSKETEKEIAVMIIDLDKFKSINDTYGHLAGDRCLKSVANSISQELREGIDLLGRFGGEEFIIITDDVSATIACSIAEKIRSSIEQNAVDITDSQSIKVTATIGVFTFRVQEHNSIEYCIGKADEALYQGKKAGRNQVVVASD